MELTVQNATQANNLPCELDLKAWVAAALPAGTSSELVIRVVDEAESRQLNHDYRGKDRPTNVLSFPSSVPPEIATDSIGDLVICASIVEQEALEQNKDLTAHWAHMVVHGVLHLCGHDHENDHEADAMEDLERTILHQLNLPDPYRAL